MKNIHNMNIGEHLYCAVYSGHSAGNEKTIVDFLDALANGWEIISATGTKDAVHYVIKKVKHV